MEVATLLPNLSYLSVVVVGAITLLLSHLYNILWLKPEKLRSALTKQGIPGPTPRFVLGNILEMKSMIKPDTDEKIDNGMAHDYHTALFPYFPRWNQTYGNTFVFSVGNIVSLYVRDPEMVKALCLSTNSLAIGQPTSLYKSVHVLFGNSVLSSSGHEWAIQRKIIAPEFFKDKVKGMMDLMVKSADQLVKSWEAKLERGDGVADIRIDTDLRIFGGDVLSRSCFGSNYTAGEEIFLKVTNMQKNLAVNSILSSLPGSRLLPTKRNRLLWRLADELKVLIENLVKQRKEKPRGDKDFLQSMINSENEAGLPKSYITDNCKTMYLAGEGSTATTALWTMLLLAYNPTWQERVRAEVMQVCGQDKPTPESAAKMTLLSQVIQETLRLYPQAPLLIKQVHQDVDLAGVRLPAGTCLWIPALHLNYDKDLWGPDADQFNPERFANGASAACKHPQMYLPFGFGPRICLGQSFAMTELKTILPMVLQRYRLSPSPNYRHFVTQRLVMEPKYGANLVVERL